MNISNQRRISARIMKVGKKRVWFDKERLGEIKEAITAADISKLMQELAIQKRPEKGTSRVRARKRLVQRRKGRQSGPGTKKGKQTARLSKKVKWMILVRGLRGFLKESKDKGLITSANYRSLYLKIKGGFFRSKRHLKLYMNEHKIFENKK
tara:strand:+ start:1467 stop:1922 length:456 start_codon:yes stop_codon:yes gene_type:complete